MKSIMEEASTISKAIENAWNRAGQPQEFTIKILELPKTSFFGLKTSKSAKIALIFNETTVKIKEQPQQKQVRPLPQRPSDRKEPGLRQGGVHPERLAEGADRSTERPVQRRPLQGRDQQRDQQRAERHDGRQARPDQRRQSHGQRPQEDGRRYEQHDRENWSPEMVESAQEWVKETLVLMGKPDITVTSHVSNNYLKLYLNQPVLDDARQEETQLKSWGSLAMEAVREKANKPLRSLRIILESKK
jgi:predicted RNA-binding protein Jag